MPFSNTMTRADAIARYTEVATRLPSPVNPDSTRCVDSLADLVDDIDVFVLDGYGVLNVGATTVPGAVEQVAYLQQLGKQVTVLTNGATLPVEQTVKKYANWGMNFTANDVVSSRNALENGLAQQDDSILWGVVGTDFAQIDQLAPKTLLLGDNPADYDAVDGFVFLSALDWTYDRQQLLLDALTVRTRPVLVGNPDLVAPVEGAMSLEPGLFAHALADAQVCTPQFYGKPFANAFDIVNQRLVNQRIANQRRDKTDSSRIAMVGDTLHTDILGGANYGWKTVLIKNHGLMKEADSEQTIAATGIRPDYIAATT